MAKIKDLTGLTFGRLKVVGIAPREQGKRASWVCICECGSKTSSMGHNLTSGSKKSCGCLAMENNPPSPVTHGASGAPEYNSWRGMIDRCYLPSGANYHLYGGRDITVCDRWRDSFSNFLEDMGSRPSPNHSIDREDGDKGYSKENCRWATASVQSSNRRPTRSKVGVLGVYQNQNGTFHARIMRGGKMKLLGTFTTLFDAVAARRSAELNK